MSDTTPPISAHERWQQRIRGNSANGAVPGDAAKDVLAYMRDIFGDGVKESDGMRTEGMVMKKIRTIEIDDLCLDVADIKGGELVKRLNQYCGADGLEVARATLFNGVPFRVSIDADTANSMLDVVSDCDPPLHPPTLRGYLNMLALEKNPPQNVQAITGFTPRSR